jgi:23S rRNA (guanosine2251-2'-O)-methyltransferase
MTRVFGFHPVREALRHRPSEVVRVLVSRERTGTRREELVQLCARHGIPLEVVAEAELSASATVVHNGFAAQLRAAVTPPGRSGDADLVVLVEDVQDPRNLGALLRVCEGAGVGHVYVRDRGSAPLSATSAKTSAGASEWLDIERVANSAQTLRRLKEEGYWVYGAAAGGVAPWELDLRGKLVLCFGGEQQGLRHLTRELCDGLVGLPMRGQVESLNLATAGAAILYEALRQRLPPSTRSR